MPGGWPGLGPVRPQRFVQSPPPALPPGPTLLHPPDEYEVSSGQWGYDIDESRSVVLTGERSIWFKSTATALAFLRHDADHQVPVEAGRRYKAWSIFQADKRHASDAAVSSRVEWLREDRSTLISTSSIYNNQVDAINTWQQAEVIATAPAGARFARISFGRADASFNAYFDEVDMLPAVPLWRAYHAGAQTIAASTLTTIAFTNAEAIDSDFDTTTGIATIRVPGWYSVNARTIIGTLDDNTATLIFIYVNGSRTRDGDVVSNARQLHSMQVTALLDLAVGDEVEIRIQHDDATGAINTVAGSNNTFFEGVRIM